MSKAQGVTMNFSLVDNQDGDCNMGFRCTSSDGLDIDYTLTGEDPESMLDELLDNVVEEMTKQYAEKQQKKNESKTDYEKELEAVIAQLQKENASLKADNKILQKRSDEKVNKAMNDKKKVKPRSNNFKFNFSEEDIDLFNRLLKLYY